MICLVLLLFLLPVSHAQKTSSASAAADFKSTAPTKFSVISQERLFAPGDEGCYWRIPAVLCLDDGTIIATCDRRKHDEGDLPHDIDVVLIRSCDNGATWSKPMTIAEGKGVGKGYGDAALVQCADGEVICTFAVAAGFWESTEENPIRTYVCRSGDRGVTWSEPEDITSTLWGSRAVQPQARGYRGSFNASGNGLRLTKGKHKGRIMFVAAMRRNDVWAADNFAVYSDDNGHTWQVSERAFEGGDEAKVIELPNGRVLMSVRQNGARGFAFSDDGGATWHGQGHWEEMKANACNGEMLMIKKGKKSILLHSLPNSMQRENVTIFVSRDGGESWPESHLIMAGPSAYSSMTLLKDGSIGMFVEKLVEGKTELWWVVIGS